MKTILYEIKGNNVIFSLGRYFPQTEYKNISIEQAKEKYRADNDLKGKHLNFISCNLDLYR